MRDLLDDVTTRAARYLDALPERPVAPDAAAVAGLAALDEPFLRQGRAPAEILRLLDEVLAPATVASAGPRYFGFVTGGVLPAALAANWMAAAWDQNSFSTISSPAGAALERVVLAWLREIFGVPAESGGALVTGATMANLCGLAAARHGVLARAGWNVEDDGLTGAPPVTVIAGDEVHASLYKPLGLLGLGRKRIVRVPVDGQGRMRADALPPIAGPTILCLQAGNVNSGAFDPAAAIIGPAKDAGAWVHVDGAFGLWAAAAPERAHLMAGYDAADSWAVDAHKWLNVPYDNAIVLVREAEALRSAMAISAAYLMQDGARDAIDHTPESSRRMRALEIWAALTSLGRDGLADLVERCCRHAARFAEGLSAAGFEVLNEVTLNQVLVSFGSDEETNAVIAALQNEGTCWCGGTHWHGRAAMRISVSSWATTEEDVERSLDAMIRVARAQG